MCKFTFFSEFPCIRGKKTLFILRQFQPYGLHVLTLGERGLGRAAIGLAAVVGDGEVVGALRAGGQQGDIDRLLFRRAGDGEGTGACRARGVHVGLV